MPLARTGAPLRTPVTRRATARQDQGRSHRIDLRLISLNALARAYRRSFPATHLVKRVHTFAKRATH